MNNKLILMLRASGLSLAAFAVQIIAVLSLTPFILHTVGSDSYGLWVFVLSLIGHFAIADLGVGVATKQYMTLAFERGEEERASSVFSTSVFLFGGIGAGILALGAAVAAAAPWFFQDADQRFAFQACFLIYAVHFGLSLPNSAVAGAIYAHLRGDIIAGIDLGYQVLRAALIVAFLSVEASIVALSLAELVADFVVWPLRILVLRRMPPRLAVRLSLFDRALLKQMMGYGFWSFITSGVRAVQLRVDNIVLAGMKDFRAVTHYSVASSLAHYSSEASYRVIFQLSTLFAQYYARGDFANLREKFLIATRVSALTVAIFCGGIVVFGKPFIILWVGPEFADSYLPLIILIGGMSIGMCLLPGWELLLATHNQRSFSLLLVAELGAKIVLALLLVEPLGLTGVALASVTPSLALNFGYLAWAPSRSIGQPVGAYLGEIARIVVPTVLVQVPIYFLVCQWSIESFAELVAIGFVIYAPLTAVLGLTLLRRLEWHMLTKAVAPYLPAPLAARIRARD